MSQASSHPNWIGRTISGRYIIEELLGQGGMSSVFKGTDPNLKRAVAIKLIHPHLSSDPEFVRRFEQEASAVAQLRHQNIIQVYDFNHDGDVYYMVLEFVPGETLQDKLTALNETGKLLSLEETQRIMVPTCNAVAFAHEHGMIHRDLKPANVMINPKGQPILMDFGVAKMVGSAQHTATGAIIGTAKYMSPEQARGDRPDARTDIYSLGVMLYEMVAGTTPFEGESTIAILMKHVTEPLPNIRQIKPDLPSALVAIIEKSLAKDRENRFQTAAEMAVALEAVSREAPTVIVLPLEPEPDATMLAFAPSQTMVKPKPEEVAPTPTPAATAEKRGGVPMWLIGVAVVVILLIIGLGAMFLLSGSSDDEGNGVAQATEIPSGAGDPTHTPVRSTPTPVQPTPTEGQATEAPAEAPATNTPLPPEPTDEAEPTVPPAQATDVLPTATAETEDTPTPEEPADTPTPTQEPDQPLPPPPPPQGMAFVPAGFFLMGSTSGQPDEQPEHPVLLDGFFIDLFEVTNAQYRACVDAGACPPANTADSFTYPGYRDDPAFDDYPVISVNWDQANAYCRFVNKRLPSEAEWEFSASGPANLTWPWGNSFNPNLSAAASPDTQPVGSFSGGASPFGLFDMAGNVNEWVLDTFTDGFYASSPPSNPVATGSGNGRIYRGGSFDNPDGAFYTTSRRYGNVRSFSEVDVGFRCAADAPNAAPPADLITEFCQVYDSFRPGAACP